MISKGSYNMNDIISQKTSPSKKREIIASLRIKKEEDIISPLRKDKSYYYQFMMLLGEGAFCKVYKALY